MKGIYKISIAFTACLASSWLSTFQLFDPIRDLTPSVSSVQGYDYDNDIPLIGGHALRQGSIKFSAGHSIPYLVPSMQVESLTLSWSHFSVCSGSQVLVWLTPSHYSL